MENIRELLGDPLVQHAVWTGAGAAVLFLGIFLSRKIISSLGTPAERKTQYRKWVLSAGVVLYCLFLVRIWIVPYLSEYIDQDLLGRISTTVYLFILFVMAVLFLRRLVRTRTAEEGGGIQYDKVITLFLTAVYLFIVLQTWSEADLLDNLTVRRFFHSGLFLAIIYVILIFIHRFINSLKVDIRSRHTYRKRASYTAAFVYLLFLIPIWAGSTRQWATVLSVIGAGVTLALRDVLMNIAGWIYIVFSRPYKAGDRIEIGNVKGDVIDIQLLQTSMLEVGNWVDGDQSTGRLVHLPHGRIFQDPLYNYTKGFEYIWDELSILVTFESDWEAARTILLAVGEAVSRDIQDSVKRKIHRMSAKYLIYYRTFTPIVYTKVLDSGVQLTLRFLTEAKNRRTCEDDISRHVIREVNRAEAVDFAYPTMRIYRPGSPSPGKPPSDG